MMRIMKKVLTKLIIKKKKTKGMFVLEVINFEVHAFLGAYYLKNENQGNELCTPFHSVEIHSLLSYVGKPVTYVCNFLTIVWKINL